MQEPDYVDIEVFVGVDIAKGDHYACVVTSAGAEVLARSVRNDEAAIGRLIDDAAVHGTVALVIDTTSSAASLLLETAARREVPVAYVTGLAMRRAADLYAGAGQDRPQRRRGARRLRPAQRRPPELDDPQRRAAGTAADTQRQRRRPRRGRHPGRQPAQRRPVDGVARAGASPRRQAGQQRRRTRRPGPLGHPHSAPLRRARPHTHPHRQTLPPHSGPAHRRHLAALDAQTITVTAEAAWGDTITELAADLDRICARRDHLAADIEAAFMGHPLGKVLASLCGFGPRTGARTLAEIGDPHRFADGGRLASYAGLAPVDWQSGRSAVSRKPRGGNHRLKNALFTAAFVATQHDPDARAYYQRKRSQGKRHNAAVIWVARRRCNIILAMLKTQTPYQEPQPQPLPQAA